MTSHNEDNVADTKPGLTADYHFNNTPKHGYYSSASNKNKAKVIGIYGIPGSGKTFLLTQLKHELNNEQFSFYEGSEVIDTLTPGGLGAFHKLDEQQKTHWRRVAIDKIGSECAISGKTAVVTGHLMFWKEEEEKGRMVYTSNDLVTYTHILYLDIPPEVVERRQRDDTERSRPPATTAHLTRWKHAEKAHLRRLCREHGILFTLLAPNRASPRSVSALLQDFHVHTEEYNLTRAENRLDEILTPYEGRLETVLVIDADRTLAAEDTGAIFWNEVLKSSREREEELPLKALFSGPLGYSYKAFRQAALLYEEAADGEEYERLCEQVASKVTMYPEFVSLLRLVTQEKHIGIVVVSCGLLHVWEKVLEREGLSGKVKIIAGGRIGDGYVVTAAVKAAIVTRLQESHQLYVWAFGDSPLDLKMLQEADRGVVVVGDERSRSNAMDSALSAAIIQDDFQARQVLLPNNTPPRLDVSKIPLVHFNEPELMSAILRRRNRPASVSIFLEKDSNAAKVLATPMRNSAISGPALREAHRRTGAYLATAVLTRAIGVEDCTISHVLGHHTTGSRLLHEQQTVVMALMRAGEPMATGVNEVFPLAMFLHANGPENIERHHLQGKSQVLLVDSVINSGKTILEFVRAIRDLDSDIRIVVVTGVVQAQCISPDSAFCKTLASHGNISLVALRCSETKFPGSGGTDTGNRLFNTTHLP